jgi:hypothetical protein
MYEAVSYGTGQITDGTPEGFGLEHYDTTPSPLQGGTGLTSSSPSFVSGINTEGNARSFLTNTNATINGYQNTQLLGSGGATVSGLSSLSGSNGTLSGLQGIQFPQVPATSNTIVASAIKL